MPREASALSPKPMGDRPQATDGFGKPSETPSVRGYRTSTKSLVEVTAGVVEVPANL